VVPRGTWEEEKGAKAEGPKEGREESEDHQALEAKVDIKGEGNKEVSRARAREARRVREGTKERATIAGCWAISGEKLCVATSNNSKHRRTSR
jgi:hypothetical protein